MSEKKVKKQLLWALVTPNEKDEGFVAKTRQDARNVKYPQEKIVRIEIVDGKINAKFVR